MTINMKAVEAKAVEMGNDMEQVRRALKRVASMKCNLKKQKGRSDYEAKMRETLAEEQLLKEVRQLLEPKEVTVTTMTQADVGMLDYDQTVKAIKSIQSKKTHTRWLTTEEGDNDEFRKACEIEAMLKAHKELVQPVEDALVRKTELQAIIDVIEATPDISRERVLDLLNGLM